MHLFRQYNLFLLDITSICQYLHQFQDTFKYFDQYKIIDD